MALTQQDHLLSNSSEVAVPSPAAQAIEGVALHHTKQWSTGAGLPSGVMAADTLDGNKVISADGEHVAKISDIMVDVRGGRVTYAVLSAGGFLGMDDTLHAIPWNAVTLDTEEKCFLADVAAQRAGVRYSLALPLTPRVQRRFAQVCPFQSQEDPCVY